VEEFNNKFDIYNTLIIDDNFFLEKINPMNYIRINAWCRYMKYDNALDRLKLWLEENKKLLLKLKKKKKKLILLNILNNNEFDVQMKKQLGQENMELIMESSYNCRQNLVVTEI
tara:strand:- start:153 stop:494 length:342 start_codon:yes stop_codon:yes gene_type:complete